MYTHTHTHTHTYTKSLQSCLSLCYPVDYSLPGSSVHGILQARILEWVAMPFSNICVKVKESEFVQSCPTLCNPMDCSLPGSSIHGIFQAETLEWVAISFSRGSSQTRDWTRVSGIVGRYFTIWATREVNICVYTYVKLSIQQEHVTHSFFFFFLQWLMKHSVIQVISWAIK